MVSSIIFSLQVTLMKGFVQPRWTQTSSVTEESRATGIHAGLWQRQRSLGDMTAQLRSATLVDLRNKGGGPKGLHRTYPRIEKKFSKSIEKNLVTVFLFYSFSFLNWMEGKDWEAKREDITTSICSLSRDSSLSEYFTTSEMFVR